MPRVVRNNSNNNRTSSINSIIRSISYPLFLILILSFFTISFLLCVYVAPLPSSSPLLSPHLFSPPQNNLEERRLNQIKILTSAPTSPLPTAQISIPIYKSSGSYHVSTYVGQQKQVLILDTGSHYMAFPCEPCLSCGRHVSNYYKPSRSPATSSTLSCHSNQECALDVSSCTMDQQCQLTVRYTEGSSWTAYEHRDEVEFKMAGNENLKSSMTFGCQYYESGLFRTQYEDGILGLARNNEMLTSVFKRNEAVKHNSFSICVDEQLNSREKGLFSIGGVNTAHHLEPAMQFTSMIPSKEGWYVVHVEDVYIGEHSIFHHHGILRSDEKNTKKDQLLKNSFNSEIRGTILDSGTTDIYLPLAIQEAFISLWEYHSRLQYTNQGTFLTQQQYERLPIVTIALENNVLLRIHPKYYMEQRNNEEVNGMKEYVNRIYLDEPHGAILGITAMRGQDVYFDLEQERIGFVRASCQIDE